MDLSHFLQMIGGLALFLYGMYFLGESLSKFSGGKMESVLSKITDNPFKGVLLGAAATALVQSSSATTVMVVGFVNSQIMHLEQAVGIIMGANIGTTLTSWLLSLSGIKSDNVFVTLLKPDAFSPVLAMTGVILLMSGKSRQKRDAGGILLGFAILMSGMDTMSSAVKPLRDIPEFTKLFVAFSNPVLGMVAGAVLTAVIQSSSASVGILQALCITGAIPYSAVLPIIMGQNIGTCVTALLSSVGASANAKRAAFIHLYFNVIGTAVFMIGFYAIHYFITFDFLGQTATPAGIAALHTCFNVFSTVILLPFSYQLVTLAGFSVPERNSDTLQKLPPELAALSNMDRRFLDNPSFALTQCKKTTGAMLALASETANRALELLFDYSKKKAVYVEELENFVDRYEERINDYMFKIGQYPLAKSDSMELSLIQHCVGNIERIADYALGIVISARKMDKKKLFFSKEAKQDLELYSDGVLCLVKYVVDYWEKPSQILVNDACQMENQLNHLEKKIIKGHKKRLKKDKCSVDLGFVLSDILLGLKKVAEHSLHIMDTVQSVEQDRTGNIS